MWLANVPWGWVAITQNQRQSSTNQAEQSYHASVEFKCTVRDLSEPSSVNSETEQYNYTSKAAEIYHNRNKQFFIQNIWGY